MGNILRQRDIIDRRALAEALAQAAGEATNTALDRSVLLPPLKAALATGRDEIRRRFETEGSAHRTVREQCFLVDQLIRVLFDFVTEAVYPDRKSTRLNSSHMSISYAGFCLHKK